MKKLSIRLALAGLLGLALGMAPAAAQDTVFPPFGNTGSGSVFDIRAGAAQQPRKLFVRHDTSFVIGVQLEYCGRDMTTSTGLSIPAGAISTPQGATRSEITFAPGEYIRRVDVWTFLQRINYLRIYTPSTSYDFGVRATGDARHNFAAPAGEQVVGFVGNCTTTALFALGIVTRPQLASDLRYGTGCTTSLGNLALRWRQSGMGLTVGTLPVLECPNVPNNSRAFFNYGFSDSSWSGVPLPFELTPLGYAGCSLYASLDFQVISTPDASHVCGHSLNLLNVGPELLGLNVYFQALVYNLNNSTFRTSDALKTSIGVL